jgi:hypothetical protein
MYLRFALNSFFFLVVLGFALQNIYLIKDFLSKIHKELKTTIRKQTTQLKTGQTVAQRPPQRRSTNGR